MTDPAAYLIDADDFAAMRAVADQLQAGNDKERDAGHRLWLLLARCAPVAAP